MGRTMVLTEKSTALQGQSFVRSKLVLDSVDLIDRLCRLGRGLSITVDVCSRLGR